MADLMLADEYGFLGGVGGSCALCNASKRQLDRPERIVTTSLVTDMKDAPPGVWPEQYMEFCEQCINEMGHLVGMISEVEAQDLVYRLTHLEETIQALKEENAQLQSEIQAVTVLRKYVKQESEPEPLVPIKAVRK